MSGIGEERPLSTGRLSTDCGLHWPSGRLDFAVPERRNGVRL